MDDLDRGAQANPEMADRTPAKKRPYLPPTLTEYGALDELVDAGLVGQTASFF